MSAQRIQLAVILGSTREGRFGSNVANWFASEADKRDDMVVDPIDLADASLPTTLTNQVPPEVAALAPRLDAADAFVVVTCEYNHSFPASLKAAIDWYRNQWQAKPIGFVSYGGMAGGLRAVEHLRLVFAELHAVTARDTVSFHNPWEMFDSQGIPNEPEACAEAAKTMLEQLAWWAITLREAKAVRPYGA